MDSLLDLLLISGGILVLLPVAVFCAECLLAVMPRLRKPGTSERRSTAEEAPTIVVLMPAHNEEAVIGKTLGILLPTLPPKARVLVVADNCTDRTAETARAAGASVVERHDATRRGKGFALDFGLAALAQAPPQVVFVLDADCSVRPDTVSLLSRRSFELGRPVQGLNLSERSADAGGMQAVSDLAFRFKNLVRPSGLLRIGVPCHLMGTGMAFPWTVVETHGFSGDHLAEDMQFGIDLAIAGYPAAFCPETGITSRLPEQTSAFVTQRTRWEQGHLRTSLTQVPRLLKAAAAQRRWDLFGLAVDLIVPPLSLLVAMYLLMLVAAASSAAVLNAGWTAAAMLGAGGAALAISIFLGWLTFCRQQVPLTALLAAPVYILRKLPIYGSFFINRRQTAWVRTAREAAVSVTGAGPELTQGRAHDVHVHSR